MPGKPTLVLVSGDPCTGKTSLARKIADHFNLPLLQKDALKEILFDQLGMGERAWSKKLSLATYQLLFHLMGECLHRGVSLVAEANFPPDRSREWLQQLSQDTPFITLEVNCVAEREILLSRFLSRMKEGKRHPGHLDQEVFTEVVELANAGRSSAVGTTGTIFTVDCSDFERVDLEALFSGIKDVFKTS